MKAALIEMHRQVGDLKIKDGIATQGLLVRHLVMPNNIAGSIEIIDFLADEISKNTYVNVMEQYRPTFKAHNYPEINRHITHEEFDKVYQYAKERGLRLAV
jgi:putative pyruvate formate lyase activating enzyme